MIRIEIELKSSCKGYCNLCVPAEGKTGAIPKAFRICKKLKNMKAKIKQRLIKEMEDFHPTETLKELSETLNNVRNEIDEVLDPILVVQAEMMK